MIGVIARIGVLTLMLTWANGIGRDRLLEDIPYQLVRMRFCDDYLQWAVDFATSSELEVVTLHELCAGRRIPPPRRERGAKGKL